MGLVGSVHPDEGQWLAYAMACFVRRMGGNREDYQLEALLAVRSALQSSPNRDQRKARIAKACNWAATDMLRTRYRRARLSRAWNVEQANSLAADQKAAEALEMVGQVQSQHPALLRYMVGDMSDAVAAGCMGITPGALRNRVYRLREKHRAA